MEILKKIAKAKEQIKKEGAKKEGKNAFSKYNYFTPEQVEHLVFNACQTNGLLTKFDLIRNEFGEDGTLTVYDISSDEKMIYTMSTAIPEIKATNVAQQLGGCVTYTERYLKMSAFGIVENSLDFDDKDNSKKPEPKTIELEWLNPNTAKWEEIKHYLCFGYESKGGQHKKMTMEDVKKKFKISKENEQLMNDQVKNQESI